MEEKEEEAYRCALFTNANEAYAKRLEPRTNKFSQNISYIGNMCEV
jgi:hypothetical protein